MGVRDIVKRYSKHVTRTRRWFTLRMAILERDGWQCRVCGERRHLEVDHVLAVRSHPERAWDPCNLQTLCRACHTRKTNVEMGRASVSPERQE
jgi:5-methylcytosine-specific restriction endonuclease McrA